MFSSKNFIASIMSSTPFFATRREDVTKDISFCLIPKFFLISSLFSLEICALNLLVSTPFGIVHTGHLAPLARAKSAKKPDMAFIASAVLKNFFFKKKKDLIFLDR